MKRLSNRGGRRSPLATRLRRGLGCGAVRVVTVAGGSGAGKTWLVERLLQRLGPGCAMLPLDAFYRDRSHLSVAQRGRVNFDHPRAVDWGLFRKVLRCWLAGDPAKLPVYDYATHSRCGWVERPAPRRILLVDGLWVLGPHDLRALCSFRIYVHCPLGTRLARRVKRDAVERGRSRTEVIRRFREQVQPMHRRFVEPQQRWADVVVRSPVRRAVVDRLARIIGAAQST